MSVTEHKRVHRHSLGDMVYTRTITPNTGETVRLTTKLDDHLGSTDVLITSKWQNNTFTHESTEYQAYDPWGERAATTTAVAFRQADADPFRRSAQDYDRGYTGHEMLDDSGIIHMNGRLYDAELGRMLSADPFVQVPEYSQNFNRYSYVLNNPLNKTDPTGYSWVSKAFHKIGAWVKENWRTVVAIVLAVAFFFIAPVLVGAVLSATGAVFTPLVTQAIIGATAGFLSGAANAALAGGDLGDVLRGGLVGAVQGAISSGPLHSMEGATSYAGKAAHVIGHGATGGAANVAMGGKFQDGFLSAAAGAAATHTGLYGKFQGSGIDKVAGRTAVAAVIGGTASALGGGKFANGAWTAAFQHLLNDEMIEGLQENESVAEAELDGQALSVEEFLQKYKPDGQMEKTDAVCWIGACSDVSKSLIEQKLGAWYVKIYSHKKVVYSTNPSYQEFVDAMKTFKGVYLHTHGHGPYGVIFFKNRQRQPHKDRTLLANVPNIKNMSVELFGVSACGFAHWEPNISKMSSYKRTYAIGINGGAKRISSFANGIDRIVTPTITKY